VPDYKMTNTERDNKWWNRISGWTCYYLSFIHTFDWMMVPMIRLRFQIEWEEAND